MDYPMTPIGIFHCDAQYPYDVPRQGTLAEGNVGEIELAEGRGFEDAAADLVGFSRIWLVFVFDRNKRFCLSYINFGLIGLIPIVSDAFSVNNFCILLIINGHTDEHKNIAFRRSR